MVIFLIFLNVYVYFVIIKTKLGYVTTIIVVVVIIIIIIAIIIGGSL